MNVLENYLSALLMSVERIERKLYQSTSEIFKAPEQKGNSCCGNTEAEGKIPIYKMKLDENESIRVGFCSCKQEKEVEIKIVKGKIENQCPNCKIDFIPMINQYYNGAKTNYCSNCGVKFKWKD